MDSSLQVGLIGNLLCEVFARPPELSAGCHGYQQWSCCKSWWCPAVYMSAVVCAEWPICPAQGGPPEASAARLRRAECLLAGSALPPGFARPRGLRRGPTGLTRSGKCSAVPVSLYQRDMSGSWKMAWFCGKRQQCWTSDTSTTCNGENPLPPCNMYMWYHPCPHLGLWLSSLPYTDVRFQLDYCSCKCPLLRIFPSVICYLTSVLFCREEILFSSSRPS